jgi:hypothetical protein
MRGTAATVPRQERYQAGAVWSIFFTDADGQLDLREMAALLEQADAHDIVAGYRGRRQDPPHRLLFAWGWHSSSWRFTFALQKTTLTRL